MNRIHRVYLQGGEVSTPRAVEPHSWGLTLLFVRVDLDGDPLPPLRQNVPWHRVISWNDESTP